MEWKEFETTFSVKLNQQQKEAVQSTKGPVLLLAVPGSGKTTVLVTRLGYMIYCKNIPPICSPFWRGYGKATGISDDQRNLRKDYPVLRKTDRKDTV